MIRFGAWLVIALACGCHRGGGDAADAGSAEETPEAKAAREAHDDAVALSATAARAERSSALVAAVAKVPLGERVSGDAGEPVYLAADDTNLYWADAQQGLVLGGAKAGGDARVIGKDTTFSPASRARVLAADADAVYWVGARVGKKVHDVGVYKADKDGKKPELLAPATDEPYELAVGDDTIYWLERPRGGDAAGTATLHAVPKAGGAARSLAQIGQACALAVDAKSVAWIEVAPKPALKKASLEGTDVATVAPANGAACSLAADERTYYWPRPDLDQLLAAPKSGGAPRVLALVGKRPSNVVVAGASLLVATEHGPDGKGDGVIYTVPIGGGVPKPIVRAVHLTSLAFDGKYPYWSAFVGDGGGGGIYRGPKP